MKSIKMLSKAKGTAILAFVLSTSSLMAQQKSLLFGDTFDRANSTNLNASATGKAGTLGALNYTSRITQSSELVTLDILNNALRINGPAADGQIGGLVYINDHNFVDSVIKLAGAFSVTVDIAAYSTAGSGRQMTVGVGQSLSALDALDSANPLFSVADLVVAYRNTTDTLEIYKNGVLDTTETVIGGLPNAPTTMRIEYALTDGFTFGSTVNYEVYFDGATTAFSSGSFVWTNTDQNYISFTSNLSNNSLFDNLSIRGGSTASDFTAPTPSPMTWATAPTAINGVSLTMTATTAYDDNGVEYYFSNTTDASHDSGWQSSPTYIDTGLTPATPYSYTVMARDLSDNNNSTAPSVTESGTTAVADNTAPNPDPMTWAAVPAASSPTEIFMTATTATNEPLYGVQYYFKNITVVDESHDSGWQNSVNYTDTELTTGTAYSYTVMARDLSENTNTTFASSTEVATPVEDTIPPSPSPMTWETEPTAISPNVITMTASTATDPNGVEYFFANITDPLDFSHDSGWQTSPIYSDGGLDPETTYTYTVIARDLSVNTNLTAVSAEASATTEEEPTNETGIFYQDDFNDDDLVYNPGIGGGTQFDTRNLGLPTETDGNLDMGRGTQHNNRGNTFSVQSFDLTGGFRLSVSYSTVDVDAGRISIGLVDADDVSNANHGGYFAEWISKGKTQYGIGMNIASNNTENAGLNFNDDSGTMQTLDTIDFTDGAESFVLEVTEDSNWSYSLNGGTAVTGTIAGAGFDFTRVYQFGTFTQNLNNETGLTIDSVTLESLSTATIGDIAIAVSGTEATLSWYGENFRSYELQVKGNLQIGGDAGWTTIGTYPGANADISTTNEIDQAQEFYRVKLAE